MKNNLLLLFFGFSLLSCSGGGGGGSGSSVSTQAIDPIYGSWLYTFPGGTASSGKGLAGIINPDGTLTVLLIYAVTDGTSVTSYYRRQTGTYVRKGDEFSITYNYETCDPIGSEILSLKIGSTNNQLISITSQNTIISLLRIQNNASPISSVMIEDKNCTILAKVEKNHERLPAATPSGSSFLRFLK